LIEKCYNKTGGRVILPPIRMPAGGYYEICRREELSVREI